MNRPGVGPGGIGATQYNNGVALLAVGNPIFGGQPDVVESVLDQRSFLLPVIPSSTTAPPYFDFLLNVGARSLVSGAVDAGHAGAVVDFNSTGLITALAFFGAAGNDITGSVAYSFTQGTLIGPIVTAVPEPASVALLAAGVLALGAMYGRRARRG